MMYKNGNNDIWLTLNEYVPKMARETKQMAAFMSNFQQEGLPRKISRNYQPIFPLISLEI